MNLLKLLRSHLVYPFVITISPALISAILVHYTDNPIYVIIGLPLSIIMMFVSLDKLIFYPEPKDESGYPKEII